jgi:hypothetical protein
LPVLAPCGSGGLAAVLPSLLLLAGGTSCGTVAARDHGPGGLLCLGVVLQQVRRSRLRRTPVAGDLGPQFVGEVRALGVAEQFHRLPEESCGQGLPFES